MSMTDNDANAQPAPRRRQLVIICVVVFLVACGVRVLHWQDNRQGLPFAGMHAEYRTHALVLVNGDLKHFLYGFDPPSDANFVKHPPGYPLLLAFVFKLFGQSDTTLAAVHIMLDALACALVVLLAAELFPVSVASIAGLLVAFAPQLAYHAIAPVPDPLATPPMLLAFYFLVRAWKHKRLRAMAVAGALIGVSCWLRSNALLFAPLLVVLIRFLFARGERLRFASVLVGAYVLVIAPVTVRNYVAFGRFIPLSLSAGITLVEGIGVYDKDGRFGLPDSDYRVTKWEAQMYNRPDYLGTRFKPDGVLREQSRIRHGLAVVRAHPLWFFGVMLRRAADMPRLARVETVAPQPAVTHAPQVAAGTEPVQTFTPPESRRADEAATTLFVSPPLPVQPETDYLLRLPLKIEAGSVVVDVLDAQGDAVLASTSVLHPVNWLDLTPERQPAVEIARPFVSGDAQTVRVRVRNGYRKPARVVATVGRMELFALGPARNEWTRYPRLLVHLIERLFLTATMLPLVLLGAARLVRAGRWRVVAILIAPAVYYMCVQSILWTEFRYILAMHYFLFILAAFALHWLGQTLWHVDAPAETDKAEG